MRDKIFVLCFLPSRRMEALAAETVLEVREEDKLIMMVGPRSSADAMVMRAVSARRVFDHWGGIVLAVGSSCLPVVLDFVRVSELVEVHTPSTPMVVGRWGVLQTALRLLNYGFEVCAEVQHDSDIFCFEVRWCLFLEEICARVRPLICLCAVPGRRN